MFCYNITFRYWLKTETMCKLLLFVLIAMISLVQCYKKETVGPRPKPMKNFVAQKITGRWFVQARFITCHYQGARGFTDIVSTYTLVDNKYFELSSTQRAGQICSTLVDRRYFKPEAGTCAVHFAKDLIGNMYSGERVIPATDYKTFLVSWFCLEYSQEDPTLCDDPGISVYTRDRIPSQYTRRVIDEVLMHHFKLVAADLDAVTHDNPC